MDVYVVLEEESVLGVATSEPAAEEIADRGSPGQWSPWRVGPADVNRSRERTDCAATQRIVRTPLAGAIRLNSDGLRGELAWVPEPRVRDEAPILAFLNSPVQLRKRLAAMEEIKEIGRSFGAP